MSAFFHFQHTLNIFFNNSKWDRAGAAGGGGQFEKKIRQNYPQKAKSY